MLQILRTIILGFEKKKFKYVKIKSQYVNGENLRTPETWEWSKRFGNPSQNSESSQKIVVYYFSEDVHAYF